MDNAQISAPGTVIRFHFAKDLADAAVNKPVDVATSLTLEQVANRLQDGSKQEPFCAFLPGDQPGSGFLVLERPRFVSMQPTAD